MNDQNPSIEILGPVRTEYASIFTKDALNFISALHENFDERIQSLLAQRNQRQKQFDAGLKPDFLSDTTEIRSSDWVIEPVPAVLQDRRVEITGPVDRKMIINALNSGAKVFMADFEDSSSPTWHNMISGQIHLRDAVAGTIHFEDTHRGKTYQLNEQTAALMVRPRGLHLREFHLRVHDGPVAASLVDFGLFFFHNAQALAKGGKGPFFYLPKLEHHLEARLWNDIFIYSEEALGLKRGTTKATVLIETLPAAFQMDEILYELREHSAGLNCGRWDYIFSYIKTMRAHAAYTLPDRGQVGMTQPCMRAYSQLAIQTCHRRGAHAMGGMAAQIPIKNDPVANEQALAKVRADKEREVTDGHDGTWVAHPGLVPLALEIFDAHLDGVHQIERQLDDLNVSASDLLEVPTGTRTEAGLRQNVSVGIQYLESWLRGSGCVPLYNLMEDAATAEISRTQIWQWIHHEATLEDGRPITANLLEQIITDELGKIQNSIGVEGYQAGRFEQANRLFKALCTSESLQSFLTLPAYEMITNLHSPR